MAKRGKEYEQKSQNGTKAWVEKFIDYPWPSSECQFDVQKQLIKEEMPSFSYNATGPFRLFDVLVAHMKKI